MIYDSPLHYQRRRIRKTGGSSFYHEKQQQDIPECALSSQSLFELFTTRKYLLPFMKLNFLFLLMLLSGKFVIEMYAVQIFQDVMNDGIDDHTATILLGETSYF